jgi:ParB family transcriptional regulator, chromosome partitioning protein
MSSLKDKFSGVNFLDGLPKKGEAAASRQAVTPVGNAMEETQRKKSEMLQQNEGYKAELAKWDGASPTRLLDPTEVVRGPFANRHLTNFTTDEFYELKAEISAAGGLIQPIKVRPVADGKYEIIYGHRRHEACRQLGIKVKALIEEVDDQKSFVQMEFENRSQKKLSPWEQGKTYLLAIELGLYPSNKQLAQAINVDVTSLGRIIELAKLPDEVVQAFSSPLDLQYSWATPLRDAIKNNRDAVLAKAKSISEMADRPAAKEVLRLLTMANESGIALSGTPPNKTEIMLNGKPAASFAEASNGKATIKFSVPLPPAKKDRLIAFLSELIKEDQ